jgi:thiosulfate dehydrogenase [quinone] large subunit
MLYWSSDQLIVQYPLLTLLSAIVLALPWSGRLGVAWLWARRRGRGMRLRG